MVAFKRWLLIGAIAARFLRPRKERSIEGKVVLITGASRGIGERLALAFAAQKCKLCLAARNLDELGAVADRCIAAGAADAIAIQCDVSDPEQLAAMAEKCVGQLGNVQILINNAGVEFLGHFNKQSMYELSAVSDINVRAPMILANLVIQPMMDAKDGVICNIASIAGLIATPAMSPYCASKSALLAFTFGLREEMKEHGVKVFAICPGLVTEAGMATNFGQNLSNPQLKTFTTQMQTLVKQTVRHIKLDAPNPYVVPVPLPMYPVVALSWLFPDKLVSALYNTSPMKRLTQKVADKRAGITSEADEPSAPGDAMEAISDKVEEAVEGFLGDTADAMAK